MISIQLANMIRQTIVEEYGADVCILDAGGALLTPTAESAEADERRQDRERLPLFEDDKPGGYLLFNDSADEQARLDILRFAQAIIRFDALQNRLRSPFHEEMILVEQLISDEIKQYSQEIQAKATRLGYKIAHPMSVVVVWLEPKYNYCFNMNLGYESAEDEVKKNILGIMKRHPYVNKQDIIAFIRNNYFVLLKAIEDLHDMPRLYDMQREIVKAVDDVFKTYRIFRYYVSSGSIVQGFEQAHDAFEEAAQNIRIARMLDIDHSIITPDDTLLTTMAVKLPGEYKTSKVAPIVELFKKQNAETMQGVIQCYDCYIDSGFNVAETAQRMFLHRNTVKKRLEKLRSLTGIEPEGSFTDILLLKLIMQQYLLNTLEER